MQGRFVTRNIVMSGFATDFPSEMLKGKEIIFT